MKRRDFLIRVAAAGGSTYAAMRALDLIANPAKAQTGPVRLTRPKERRRVIIIGAGVAGLTAAYELGKVGYDTVILEARNRPGGRCWTLRDGDSFEEIAVAATGSAGAGTTPNQIITANFSRGQYFNPGPARIPQHHVTLDYCRELGVALEVFSNLNRQQYYFNEAGATISISGNNAPVGGRLAGKKIRVRAALADTRGYLSELLAKAVDKGALDQELSGVDKERLLEFLRTYGALGTRETGFAYTGGSRRGWSNFDVDTNVETGEAPGAVGRRGNSGKPYTLADLLALRFANYEAFESGSEQQMLMYEPVGGIDAIVQGFIRQPSVGPRVRYNAEVTEIRKTSSGVRVVTTQGTFEGDYCICTIPLSVLRLLANAGKTDFSAAMVSAIDQVGRNYAVTGKAAFETNRRFWEEDEDIYGGITNCSFNTSVPGANFIPQLSTIWYPSSGFGSDRGVLVGYYNFGVNAANFGLLRDSDRIRIAVAQAAKIHPQLNQTFVSGVSVYWPAVKYSLGGWSSSGIDTYPASVVSTLSSRDGNIWLAGEHMSNLTGWLAGAIESAKLVVQQINQLG
ncbi:MAG: flavin monoamine oxidase family protein [Pseudanabaenaceae cyanobacterium SKYGB_i_bin29]|nr:flavin monoamine oxidase family protein [Pseudanabaenaceae cyanobacterium SKYG29]MDW8421063.1 flavin monoamine oxidase family protein [Pseudanabaenaceae cyanobacterium SKYGB_i_bin29]